MEPLFELLQDPKETVRLSAIRALGKMRSPRAVKALVATLKTGDTPIRVNRGLGDWRNRLAPRS